jgi:mRNA interferase HigB
MKVHLIKKQSIEEFVIGHATSKGSFTNWLNILKNADWRISEDIQATFGSADILGNGTDRVVFDIGGNNYRMICKYAFGEKQVHLFICWIGTHAEYTRVCREGRQYTVNAY